MEVDFGGNRELAKIHNGQVVARSGASEPFVKFGEALGIELVMWVAVLSWECFWKRGNSFGSEHRRQHAHKDYNCGLFLNHATLATFLFPFQPSLSPFSSQSAVSIRQVCLRFSAHLIFTHLQN